MGRSCKDVSEMEQLVRRLLEAMQFVYQALLLSILLDGKADGSGLFS